MHRAVPFASWSRALAAGVGGALLLGAFAAPGQGQGFGVYEQGTCAMARAGAAVAQPCDDASAIFFNPGALGADLDPGDWTLTGGATLIAVTGGFTSDATGRETDLDASPAVPPHAFARYGVTDRLAVGAGLYVPYGLGTEWPEDFEGAFTGYDNSLQSIYVQPTVSYQWAEGGWVDALPVEAVSVGGGPAVVAGTVELNQMVDLSEQFVPQELAEPAGLPPDTRFEELGIPRGTAFGSAELDGSWATGLGVHLGVHVRATDRLRFGARFLTPVDLSYDGDATFEPVETGLTMPEDNPFGLPAGTPVDALVAPVFGSDAPLRQQDVETGLTMPAQAVVGMAAEIVPGVRLMADYQWTGWSDFDRVELQFEEEALNEEIIQNYDDTHGFRLGSELDLGDAWTLGAGYIYHTAAAPPETVTPLLPEAERNHGTLGAGWRATDRFKIHAAYHLLEQNDRRGRTRGPRVGEPTTELNDGLYTFRAHLFGVTLTMDL